MNSKTHSRKAFNNVSSALALIEEYYKTKKVANLEVAENKLEFAKSIDPEYQDAVYYLGITKDLIGKPVESVPYFERIIKEARDLNVRIEAKYNLGVSYYHLYGHRFLVQAEEKFNEVLGATFNIRLLAQTYANLAQTYAMWMIPSSAQKREKESVEGMKAIRDHIASKLVRFNKMQARLKVYLWILKIFDPNLWRKVEAVAENAKGMALMYRSDYDQEWIHRIKKLNDAEMALEKSEKLVPGDWANTCDRGSVNMRLALVSDQSLSKEAYFQKAITLFDKVIKELRPEYGFAYYELGRIFRLKKDFDNALENFDKSLKIDKKYRDVGDDTVNAERSRAEDKDSSFP